jgi:hypothetical protein
MLESDQKRAAARLLAQKISSCWNEGNPDPIYLFIYLLPVDLVFLGCPKFSDFCMNALFCNQGVGKSVWPVVEVAG